ncbi:dienelactone hydrolase family protein [Pseudomonas cavernae]|uniref:Dienelactone hydrolase family protein n=1 Tax=Pseudomonas cavernae TaxID=2320867 RepID=A0A385Z5S7_9PSED|nr:dienelactone hydrolase family protein [Pseudomonas cavernae]AYC33323.1 dienelactone hydrolase family protein [Pseudomonas cavernae]
MNQIVNRAIPYEIDGQVFEGQLVYDESVQRLRPGLLMAPNWMGVSAGAIEMAKQLAGPDYVIFIADVYGQKVRPQNNDEAGAAMMAVKPDAARLRKRLQAALRTLQAQGASVALDGAKLAAFGFCFGGYCALELARDGAPFKATVSFHGTLDTANPADARNIKGSVLVLDGAGDPFVPREQLKDFIAEMTAAGVDWQLTSYGGAVHSFTDPQVNIPGKMQYNPKVAKRAFAAMRALLDEVFA